MGQLNIVVITVPITLRLTNNMSWPFDTNTSQQATRLDITQ